MTIIFTTLDGERVETQNVDRLFEAAREGKIAPTTVVEVDGKRVWAGKIKKLFPPRTPVPAGDQSPEPVAPPDSEEELPEQVKTAFGILYVFIYISAICGILYATLVGVAVPAIGFGVAISSIIWTVASYQFLRILEYIATKISK